MNIDTVGTDWTEIRGHNHHALQTPWTKHGSDTRLPSGGLYRKSKDTLRRRFLEAGFWWASCAIPNCEMTSCLAKYCKTPIWRFFVRILYSLHEAESSQTVSPSDLRIATALAQTKWPTSNGWATLLSSRRSRTDPAEYVLAVGQLLIRLTCRVAMLNSICQVSWTRKSEASFQASENTEKLVRIPLHHSNMTNNCFLRLLHANANTQAHPKTTASKLPSGTTGLMKCTQLWCSANHLANPKAPSQLRRWNALPYCMRSTQRLGDEESCKGSGKVPTEQRLTNGYHNWGHNDTWLSFKPWDRQQQINQCLLVHSMAKNACNAAVEQEAETKKFGLAMYLLVAINSSANLKKYVKRQW